MKRRTVRLTFFFLALVLCLAATVSCAQDSQESTTDTQSAATDDGDDIMNYNVQRAELEQGAVYRISVLDAEFESAALTAENFAMTDNSMLKVKLYTKDLSQMWRVCQNDDGTYSLENMATLMKMSIVNPDNYKKETGLSVCLDNTNDIAKKQAQADEQNANCQTDEQADIASQADASIQG